MQRPPGGADLESMAAILFFVAILGLLFAGRTQAQAADGSKPVFSFQLWQLGLAPVLPLLNRAARILEDLRVAKQLVLRIRGLGESIQLECDLPRADFEVELTR